MDDSKIYVDMLLEILNKQITTLEEILAVTKEQERLADEAVFDEKAFDDTLTKKDIYIIRLNEYDDGFVSVYGKVKKAVDSNKGAYKSQIIKMQELIKKSTDIGNEIRTLETRNSAKISKCFAAKRQEYSAKQTAATVVGKYSTIMRNAGVGGEGYRFNKDK